MMCAEPRGAALAFGALATGMKRTTGYTALSQAACLRLADALFLGLEQNYNRHQAIDGLDPDCYSITCEWSLGG